MFGSRPRVAIIGTRGYPSYYGGFETAVRHLTPYLIDAGWDVTVYGRPGATVPDDPSRDHRARVVETWGVSSRSLSTLTHGATASWHAAGQRPDVALVMNVANGFWLPLLKSLGVPTLVNVDGMEWKRDKWGPIARGVFAAGARVTARTADELVVDSREIGRLWGAEFGRTGVYIPYGGAEYAADDRPPEFPRRQYVLFVARLVPENSVSEFVAAAELIAGSRDVVIVGSSGHGGELERSVDELARRNPRVHWLGHVSDDRRLHALWHHAGAYFHGHSVGGTNPALVQAMLCGAPVVARDTVFNREVLGASGIFTSVSPRSIADSLRALLDDPARQESTSRAVVERGRSLYSWQGVLEAYERELAVLANVPVREREERSLAHAAAPGAPVEEEV